MTAPHPAAVGSYGPECVAWAAAELGLELRWWQRLVLYRALEHDAAGALVWWSVLVSTPRQVGKSWTLRVLLSWRIHQAERFGEVQLALHTGKDLNVCHEVQRPARAWARTRGYKVRETNGQQEIESPEGSRWMIRGRDSLYGYSASLAVVDEAWKVAAEVVEDGLEPTMAERSSPQLALVSTAHRMATPLMPDRRRGALADLATPADALLLEWSAVRESGLGDPAAWRRASPYWSDRRERLVRSTYARAMAAEVSDDPDEPDPREAFRSQWLNVWPMRSAAPAGAEVPLLPDGLWSSRRDLGISAGGPLVLALEDYYGMGAGAAAVGTLPDGRLLVWGRTFPRRAAGAEWLAGLALAHPGCRVVVGVTLDPDPAVAMIGAAPVTATANHTRRGLALLREYTLDGRLVHDGGEDLAEQVTQARVRQGPAGLVLGRHRADLVRAVAWAVSEAVGAEVPAGPFQVM